MEVISIAASNWSLVICCYSLPWTLWHLPAGDWAWAVAWHCCCACSAAGHILLGLPGQPWEPYSLPQQLHCPTFSQLVPFMAQYDDIFLQLCWYHQLLTLEQHPICCRQLLKHFAIFRGLGGLTHLPRLYVLFHLAQHLILLGCLLHHQ